jgi:hypothetical protein
VNSAQDQKAAEKKRKILFYVFGAILLAIVLTGAYFVLSRIKADKAKLQASQEQFVGGAETSQQLQAECQRSASEVSNASNIDEAIAEFKKHVESCREVYFAIEKKSPDLRNEGMYPDLVVDLANLAARNDKAKAMELLNFAKGIGSWEFYMGPVVCSSKSVLEAVIESLNLPNEKICVKRENFRKELLPELKNRNFGIFTKLLPNYKAAWLGLPDSDVGCPEKISSLMKIAQNAAAGSEATEEEQPNTETLDVNVVYKAKTEDKLIIQFAQVNDCLELKAVLVPGLQTNE